MLKSGPVLRLALGLGLGLEMEMGMGMKAGWDSGWDWTELRLRHSPLLGLCR